MLCGLRDRGQACPRNQLCLHWPGVGCRISLYIRNISFALFNILPRTPRLGCDPGRHGTRCPREQIVCDVVAGKTAKTKNKNYCHPNTTYDCVNVLVSSAALDPPTGQYRLPYARKCRDKAESEACGACAIMHRTQFWLSVVGGDCCSE